MEQTPKHNWWGRNWKWSLPVGCLGVLFLFVGSIALILLLVLGIMRSTDVYKQALTTAKADPAVVAALGTPIKQGIFASGNIKTSGPSGQANLSIPLSGPQGRATVYAVATKLAGRWTFSTLTVEIDDSGARIDLIE